MKKLNSIDNFFLSVFEIFDFKRFSGWPWLMAFKSQLRSILPTIRKHMHDFLSNFYRHFLSRIVFEIFDFKLFRVYLDLWALTCKGQLRSYFYTIRKPIRNFLSYLYWHFLSISYHFRNIRFQTFQSLTFTFELQRSTEVKFVYNIRKPTHDFLYNFHWHFLSISYCFRNIRLQPFQGLDLWPLEVNWFQIFSHDSNVHIWLLLTSMDTISLSISYRFRENASQKFEGRTIWQNLTVQRVRSWLDCTLL